MADSITTDEAVTLSGYNLEYIRRLIRNKKIEAEKKGGHYWVSRQSLMDYLATNKETVDKRVGPKNKPTD
jgi:excisionase family DNA binding protein